jgi:hypothetical protein
MIFLLFLSHFEELRWKGFLSEQILALYSVGIFFAEFGSAFDFRKTIIFIIQPEQSKNCSIKNKLTLNRKEGKEK